MFGEISKQVKNVKTKDLMKEFSCEDNNYDSPESKAKEKTMKKKQIV